MKRAWILSLKLYNQYSWTVVDSSAERGPQYQMVVLWEINVYLMVKRMTNLVVSSWSIGMNRCSCCQSFVIWSRLVIYLECRSLAYINIHSLDCGDFDVDNLFSDSILGTCRQRYTGNRHWTQPGLPCANTGDPKHHSWFPSNCVNWLCHRVCHRCDTPCWMETWGG